MDLLAYLSAWIGVAIVFAGLDAIWLAVMTRRLYRPLLGDLLSAHVDSGAAIAFYVLYITGIVFFAVAPAARHGDLPAAALNGAALGLVAYGAYDLTNQATLRAWDVRVTLADMAWGAVLSAAAASGGYFVSVRLVL